MKVSDAGNAKVSRLMAAFDFKEFTRTMKIG